MTFPQPSSTQPVLNGEQFWRLNTLLSNPGDIYEAECSALAIAVGPNSDIATYLVTYFDANSPTSVSQFLISPDRDVVGRVDARNDAQYPGPGARKGRALISIADIYDPVIRPTAWTNGEDSIEYETPIIDVIWLFENLPSIVAQRSDRIFRYQYLRPPLVVGKSSFLLIPAYGRKSGYFSFTNGSGAPVTVNLSGLRLATTNFAAQATLSTSILAGAASAQYAFKSSSAGLWDLFCIELDGYAGASMPISITLSDDAI